MVRRHAKLVAETREIETSARADGALSAEAEKRAGEIMTETSSPKSASRGWRSSRPPSGGRPAQ
jgi:hypothetical protein